ncbi:methylglyoxal synthase [Ruminiclostridium cellulolyticum]|uniref:MGS domain protein n=1 Tax=Ruminiclostridium cellulolyticum (strain ATCC 35319 / DSM 5812 / JCM 6584 / H10) TaxID=394503 RepID=B8I6B9_RUMCH|nr:methylglyoxal synthase [Ruminiclostridium cellulolyticum]ACL76884.1 MGS domain protein [Ruminiclostridium cellulolyticum H10]
MNIAFIAHDNKKELMASFCIAYKSILQDHHIIATRSTGIMINKATGLNVNLLAYGSLGAQQLSARIACDEIDLLIYFRDSNVEEDPNNYLLFKHCDVNNIPFATNIASAEVLIKGLERGDLAWRELLRQD